MLHQKLGVNCHLLRFRPTLKLVLCLRFITLFICGQTLYQKLGVNCHLLRLRLFMLYSIFFTSAVF